MGYKFDIDKANICHWRNDAISVLFSLCFFFFFCKVAAKYF